LTANDEPQPEHPAVWEVWLQQLSTFEI